MTSAVELVQVPLNSGQREDTDKRLLPAETLRRAKNVRLRKTGALGVRFGYVGTPTQDDAAAALTVYDVASHADTLLAFGATGASPGGPERVFTYTGGAWRAEDHGDNRTRAFSAISDLREVYRPSFVKTDESMRYDLAYADGWLALVYEGDSADGSVYVSVFDAATGAEIVAVEVEDRSAPRVAAAGDVFAFAWVDTSGDVRMATFDPSSDTALSSETTVHTAGTVTAGLDLVSVTGSTEVLLVVVRSDNNTGTLYRLSQALATQATGSMTDTDVVYASAVSASGGVTHVAYVDTGNVLSLETFTTSTLASAVGPTVLDTGEIPANRPPGVLVKGTDVVVTLGSGTTATTAVLVSFTCAAADHAHGSPFTHFRLSTHSKPFISSDSRFVGVLTPFEGTELINFTAIADALEGQGLECAVHRGFSVDCLTDWIGSVVTDGTSHWAVFPVTDLNCSYSPVVAKFRARSPERRQTATLGGLLYVAGGYVGVWDGQRLVESGFLETPRILSVGSTTATGGEVSPNTFYSYVAVFEWIDAKGNRHLSPVSDPATLTTSGGGNAVTLQVTTPHSSRRVLTNNASGKVLVYRTLAAPDRTHRRVLTAFTNANLGQEITLTDTASDAEAITEEVVYTQGARGSLSGPLQHEAPQPASYLWAKADRLLAGGLPVPSTWQQSKKLFPEEPVEFSGFLGFFGDVGGRQRAVASQDDSDYVFTRNRVFVVQGIGPDDNGNGEFNAPRLLPGDDVGCIDWRSLVATAAGVWFQANPDRLYLLPRGGGAPQWASQPVRETLAAFPVVTAATVVSGDNVACWAVTNAAGTAGRLVCHDTRTGDWYVDELDDLGGPITAMCEHLGRLAVVVGGRVFLQDSSFPASAFIPYAITTGSIAPFGTEGHGKLVSAMLTTEFRGDCRVSAEISYDDEGTFEAIGSNPFSVEGRTVGETVTLQWWPRRRKGSRFTLRFNVESLDGSASEGLLLNNLTLEVQPARKGRRTTVGERR